MHILVESQFFYPEQMRINDICLALVERGHTVTVVTSIPNYPQGKYFTGYGLFRKRKETYKGISIIHLPVVPRGKGFLGLTFNYISFVVSGWLFAYFSSLKPDVLFMNMSSPMTQSLVGTWFAKRRRIPSLIYIMDLWPESFEVITGISSPMLLKPLGKMVDHIYARVDRVLTSSHGFLDVIAKRGVPTEKLEYWPQYAEEFYAPLPKVSSSPIPADSRLKIIFTGNVGLAQGLDLLIPVAKSLQTMKIPVCFVIVGDGSYKDTLIASVQTNHLQDSFVFIPRQPAPEIPQLLAQADAALVILKKSEIFSKTLPAKVQSYMACALPLIVSADGEASRVVLEAEAGFTAPAEKAEALVEAISKFSILGKDERKQQGLSAKAYSERTFQKNALIDRLEYLLKTIGKEENHVQE
ncbi:MAG: glycosyltransferase WbuB [Bacteroidia bacterium]|nr:glycosyltransferase WbuB [Bacteroidia bacterium]